MLRIALIQQPASRDREANIAKAVQSFKEAACQGARLIAFAELAFDWFYPQKPAGPDVASLAEPIPGPTTDRFAALAKEHGVVAVLNLFERDGHRCYDCSPVIDADGTVLGKTRMVHVPDYSCFHEQSYYAPGDRGAPVFATQFGRVGICICYDRHFPEYLRALALNGADLVVVPQAGAVNEWPDGLFEAEMRVAAFQNGYFVALCNRVGPEECLTFAGESFVSAPDGTVVARAPAGKAHILYADLDLSATATSHARRYFLQDRRPALYPDWLGR